MKVGRHIPPLDESLYGGHFEVDFVEGVVGDDAVLDEVDQGFRYAQVRLAPARMTYCMALARHRPVRPGHRARRGR